MAAGIGPPRSEPGHYGMLLASAFALLFVQGVAPAGRVLQVVVTALAAVCVVLALRAARVDPRIMRAAVVFALAVVGASVLRALAGGVGEGAARVMNAALIAVGPPAVAVGVLRELRATRRVRLEAVMGVLSLYLLIGMFFAFVYGAIDRLGAEPFFASGATASLSHCIYFSFTTLTTVGYGDLVAQSDLGHTLAVVEALVGQIYLVTVVSLIVSNLGRPARPAG